MFFPPTTMFNLHAKKSHLIPPSQPHLLKLGDKVEIQL